MDEFQSARDFGVRTPGTVRYQVRVRDMRGEDVTKRNKEHYNVSQEH